MSYGSHTHNQIERDESPLEDETTFACACGDEQCIGHNDDAANINIHGTWYAADCAMANHHPLVVASRERDAMNERRR